MFCLEDIGVNLFLVFSDSRGCLLPVFKEHASNVAFILQSASSDWLMQGPFPLLDEVPHFSLWRVVSLSAVGNHIGTTQTTQDHLPISLSPLCKPPSGWIPPCSFLVPSRLVGLRLLLGPRSMLHPSEPPHSYNFVSASFGKYTLSNYFKSAIHILLKPIQIF